MRVKLVFKHEALQKIEKELKNLNIEQFQSEQIKGETMVRIYDIEPNKYRDLSHLAKEKSLETADVTLEVVVNVVANQSTKDLENEISSALQPLVKTNKE